MNSLKKTLLATACASAMTLGATTAQADGADITNSNRNFYVSVFGGVSLPHSQDTTFTLVPYNFREKFKTGFVVGGAIGVDSLLIENLRTEVEVSYFSSKPKSLRELNSSFFDANPTGHNSSVNILANAWYDVDLGMRFSPYIGGGAGIGIVNNKLTDINVGLYKGTDVGFAFQLGAGFKYSISDSMDFDIGYRFRGVIGTKPKTPLAGFGVSISKADDIFVHTVQAGISLKF
jgi:opacity protein-like surface antigen